jgi:hypothetical protein
VFSTVKEALILKATLQRQKHQHGMNAFAPAGRLSPVLFTQGNALG